MLSDPTNKSIIRLYNKLCANCEKLDKLNEDTKKAQAKALTSSDQNALNELHMSIVEINNFICDHLEKIEKLIPQAVEARDNPSAALGGSKRDI